MQAPILTVQIGWAENILILAFVIIVSRHRLDRGAFLAATRRPDRHPRRAYPADLLRQVLSSTAASTAAPRCPRC